MFKVGCWDDFYYCYRKTIGKYFGNDAVPGVSPKKSDLPQLPLHMPASYQVGSKLFVPLLPPKLNSTPEYRQNLLGDPIMEDIY